MNIPNTHRQEHLIIERPDGKEVEFDCDNLIAPLVKKLNEVGLYTKFSCSGHEDTAFYDMYLYFEQLDNDTLDRLYDLAGKCSEHIIIERIYRMHSIGNSRHRIFLTDPTDEELGLALKLCFGINLDTVFTFDEKGHAKRTGYFEKAVRSNIIFRPSFFIEDKDSKDHMEENYEKVMAAIKHMESLL